MPTITKPKPKKKQPAVVNELLKEDVIVDATGYTIRYEPIGGAREAFLCKEDEVLMAGPAGTGKSLALLQKVHLILGKYAGARAAMCRKTRASMTTTCMKTFENHVLKPPDKVFLLKNEQVYKYPSGSEFCVVGLDDPEKIKSSEYDIIYIQEATEVTVGDLEVCRSRLRNWVVPYQQLLLDCNPDKPTHWLKKRCDVGKTHMIPSTHKDNPRLWDRRKNDWTALGKTYVLKTLAGLTGVRRARLYAGLWAAAEGMVYTEWDASVHLINRTDLPKGHEKWPHYWAIDWGFTHPCTWQDWIEDPETGIIIMVNQIYHTKMLVEDLAKQVMSITKDDHVPRAIICDHDAEDRATFEKHTGYPTLPAYKAIKIGIEGVQSRLKVESKWGNRPGLYLVRDTLQKEDKELKDKGLPFNVEEEIDGYAWDTDKNIEVNSKKDELPIDLNNHGCDAKRYMVAFVDSLADDPADIEGILFPEIEEVVISAY